MGGESISQASTGQIAASITKALCHSWACFIFLLGDTSGISFLVFMFNDQHWPGFVPSVTLLVALPVMSVRVF